MSFQIDSVRSRGFWVRCLMIVCMAPFLVACAKGGYQRQQAAKVSAPSLENLKSMLPDLEIEKGWEPKFEKFVALNGLGADRYDWQAPVRGSFLTEGFKDGTFTKTHNVGWFGCGWAYYANPPKGIKRHAVRIAAGFSKGKVAGALYLNSGAREACRYAPSLLPTNVPTGPITASVGSASKGKETVTRRMSDGSINSFVRDGEEVQSIQGHIAQ